MQCPICASQKNRKIRSYNFFFPIESSNPEFHKFSNYYCEACGVVFMFPVPKKLDLINYYNGQYRLSEYAIKLDDGSTIDLPVKFPWSCASFSRFRSFQNAIAAIGIRPQRSDSFLDFGGYQGLFLYAVNKAYNCQCINYDYNLSGLDFSAKLFGFKSVLGKDICSDKFDRKFEFISLIHVFEHLENPNSFLKHVKENVIKTDGILYIEVPSAYGNKLSDPTHFFTYTTISLTNTLQRNGFHVKYIEEHGWPNYGWSTENGRKNISCLAVISNENIKQIEPIKYQRFEREINTRYLTIVTKNMVKRIKRGTYLISSGIIFPLIILGEYFKLYNIRLILRIMKKSLNNYKLVRLSFK